jgi:hypothetical protein
MASPPKIRAARKALQQMRRRNGAAEPTAKILAAREALASLSGETQLVACKPGEVAGSLEQKAETKMKPTSKKRKGEPEITSGSKGLSRSAPPIVAREKLAAKVEKLAVEAFRMYEQSWKKLSELRPLIAQLRELFMKLKAGEQIAGCTTWTAYCQKVLHRTDRRIRQILKGANPASEKHSPKSLQAKNDTDMQPEPTTVKVPQVHNADWTPEMVVETSFTYVYSVFQKAQLPEEDHNKAVEQLLDKLRHEIALGD